MLEVSLMQTLSIVCSIVTYSVAFLKNGVPLRSKLFSEALSEIELMSKVVSKIFRGTLE